MGGFIATLCLRNLLIQVQLCKGKFQPLSTALCGEQLVQRVEYLHSKARRLRRPVTPT